MLEINKNSLVKISSFAEKNRNFNNSLESGNFYDKGYEVEQKKSRQRRRLPRSGLVQYIFNIDPRHCQNREGVPSTLG